MATALAIGRGTQRKERQNLDWAIGYNSIALPIAGGALDPSLGLVLRPEIGALAMSGSTVLVAVNALLLSRRYHCDRCAAGGCLVAAWILRAYGVRRPMTRRYNALQEFFLGYFHPDWRLDDDSRDAVVDRFKRTAEKDAAGYVAADLVDLLAEPLSEEDLHEKVLSEYSLFYDPWRDEVTMREWLEGLLKEMEGNDRK